MHVAVNGLERRQVQCEHIPRGRATVLS
jgi:hypothetical protein